MKALPQIEYYNIVRSLGFEWVGLPPKRTKINGILRCGGGHEWFTSYDKLRQGCGCPYCSRKAVKRPRDFIVAAQNAGIEWIGPEVPNATTDTFWKCPNGHVWKAPYNRIAIAGSRCGVCFGKNKKLEEDYIFLARCCSLTWLGPFPKRVRDRTEWMCPSGHRFFSRYADIKKGHWCPICRRPSVGENKIAMELIACGLSFERQKTFNGCKNERLLPFDFYVKIREGHVLIEFDGKQHFEPTYSIKAFNDTIHRDKIKTNFAKENDISLIRIPYTEMSKISSIIRDLMHA